MRGYLSSPSFLCVVGVIVVGMIGNDTKSAQLWVS